ncbi:transaldolase [Subtercola boreus]|uniref:Transaldolase n=1 Tax=Subtercola boreus TaxID=120213 RepID=A0A3E0VYD9_9MICO|nr:transaldolase [Subtercola boreus]RFA15072.1 transaldolase [Subtercola boreus]
MPLTASPTQALTEAGVSIWLDDLSRHAIDAGTLDTLIVTRNVTGVTTNPTIFAAALSGSSAYDRQLQLLANRGSEVKEAVFEITTDDVVSACDTFRPIYDKTGGVDGRVSIEVAPALAHDGPGTAREAAKLHAKIGRPNLLIKIPATRAGLDAITAVTAVGISVNVTLIFSLQRYRDVIAAYLAGLAKAEAAGLDLAEIHSVASFFISRVDTEIDSRLRQLGTAEALKLTGLAGIANARLAYEVYEHSFSEPGAVRLLKAGANRQRPLWASTGVKSPHLADTAYVTELIAPGVVNTMPAATLDATFDHGDVRTDTIRAGYTNARAVLGALAAVGVDYDDVTATLEQEGIEKFTASWDELCQTVAAALTRLTT